MTHDETVERVDGIVHRVCVAVAELPDRTSPEDEPDMMLVNHDELSTILRIALSALPRAETDDGWRTIESAPKTDPVNMRALPFLGWCPDKTAPLGGDIRVIWWEPVMQRADETSPRARWYGDRDVEERPTHWRPLPAPPAQAGER